MSRGAFAAVMAIGRPLTASAAAAHNVVLGHGAIANESSWDKVASLLRKKGFHVTEVDNPLTSLGDGLAATRKVLGAQIGATILVGHFLRRRGPRC
jgi:pimeloyl-ACP methyl ester carboxylesterase